MKDFQLAATLKVALETEWERINLILGSMNIGPIWAVAVRQARAAVRAERVGSRGHVLHVDLEALRRLFLRIASPHPVRNALQAYALRDYELTAAAIRRLLTEYGETYELSAQNWALFTLGTDPGWPVPRRPRGQGSPRRSLPRAHKEQGPHDQCGPELPSKGGSSVSTPSQQANSESAVESTHEPEPHASDPAESSLG